MSKQVLALRYTILTVIGVALALFVGNATSWWADGLAGLSLALVFTVISEGILRGNLWGKIGSGLIAVYSVHLVAETITYAALLALCGYLTGFHIGSYILFYIFVALGWVTLCQEAIRSILRLTMLWFASHR